MRTHSKIPLVDLQAQQRSIGAEITAAIARVEERQMFVNGPEVAAFEVEFANWCTAPRCIAVSSGTTALELTLQALEVGPGDEVITVSHTFFATVGAIARRGATPVLIDVDPRTWTMDPDRVAAAVGPRTKAIVPVHLYGNPADIPAISRAAPGVAIVEDAAQAHGARYHDRPLGSASAAACYSFYPGKTLGAHGDAGAITTGDAELADRVSQLRDHGRAGGKYEHLCVGTNARMAELQAAVLRAKLPHLTDWIDARQRIAAMYQSALAGHVPTQEVEPWAEHTWHLFVALHPNRDGIRPQLQEQGIATGVHYPIPVHRQPAMEQVEHRIVGDLAVTDQLASTCLSLPIYPELGEDDVRRVLDSFCREIGVVASRG
jgi:dTDP-4-amino-4,6-dideoxygalactose transaminase